jgi:putative drug exporter of the RND superfamily
LGHIGQQEALMLDTVSLSATFGTMVWVFQDGHLGWLFSDLTTTGCLVPTMPPLMLCLVLGTVSGASTE